MKTLLASLAAIAMAAPFLLGVQSTRAADLPHPSTAFAGPCFTMQSDPEGMFVPTEFAIPAWPYPGGLSPLTITGVEIHGVEHSRFNLWGIENTTEVPFDFNVYIYGRHALDYVDYPQGWTIANMGQSWGASPGATLTSFDGTSEGQWSWPSKPAGPSAYWGGNSSTGLPNTVVLYVPMTLGYSHLTWWADDPKLLYNPQGYWSFYDQDTTPGHVYWEDRVAGMISNTPTAISYVYDPDGVGPMPEQILTLPWTPGQPVHLDPFEPRVEPWGDYAQPLPGVLGECESTYPSHVPVPQPTEANGNEPPPKLEKNPLPPV